MNGLSARARNARRPCAASLSSSRQQGVSLSGFLLSTVAVVFSVVVVAKLLPAYLEYYGLAKALQGAAASGDENDNLGAVRARFSHGLDSQYIDSHTVQSQDLSLRTDASQGRQLVLAYDKQIHMFYNIDALLHFKKTVPFRGTADSEAQ